MEDTIVNDATQVSHPATIAEAILEANKEIKNAEAKDKDPGTKRSDSSKDEVSKDAKPDGASSETKSERTEQSETKVTDKSELSDLEKEYANNLFLALKDPEKAAQVIRSLAEQAGVIETKKEAAAAVKTLTEVLKEELGDELGFMADKLAPALEKIVSQLIQKETKDIRDTEAQRKEVELNNTIDGALASLVTEYPDFKDHEAEVLKLMDSILPGKGTTPKDYFETLYFRVKAKADKAAGTQKTETKLNKSRNDGANALETSKRVGGDPAAILKQMDINAAIKAAKEQIEKG